MQKSKEKERGITINDDYDRKAIIENAPTNFKIKDYLAGLEPIVYTPNKSHKRLFSNYTAPKKKRKKKK